MHLAQRAYILIVLTAVLAITGIWSSHPGFEGLWRIPAALLLLGLAWESAVVRRIPISVAIETAPHAFLGRAQPAAFAFRNDSSRAVAMEYAPVLPDGFAPLWETRRVLAPARGTGRDSFLLLPIKLGAQPPRPVSSRLRGPLGLAWWSRDLQPSGQLSIAPDTSSRGTARPRGHPSGPRSRRAVGAGAELYQLRGYRAGDPMTRIDWKATARARRLVTREFSEDQHLDILIAIDAGRFSRVRVGSLDRFGLYANAAARFAELATANDDRIGLMVFTDRPLFSSAPARGLAGVMRVRRALEAMQPEPAESDPTAAAVRIRSILKRRGLVILLTHLDDVNSADPLAKAVRLLSPPHFVVVAEAREAREWSDPWVALAAQEHEARVALQRLLLRQLGTSVVVAPPESLDRALLAEYEALRRSRAV